MNKLFSARFWMAIMFTMAACIAFLKGMIDPTLFMGSLVVPAVVFYFNRTDRGVK